MNETNSQKKTTQKVQKAPENVTPPISDLSHQLNEMNEKLIFVCQQLETGFRNLGDLLALIAEKEIEKEKQNREAIATIIESNRAYRSNLGQNAKGD